MALKFAAPPPNITAAAAEHALAFAPPDDGRIRAAAAASANMPAIGAPHRVFVATLDDVRFNRLLANAKEAAFGYLVIAGDRVLSAAELTAGAAGVAVHASSGPLASATLDAINDVAVNLARARDYEVRLLRVPAAYLIAVWLHGDDDVLIPLEPAPPGVFAGAPTDEARLTAALQPLVDGRAATSPI